MKKAIIIVSVIAVAAAFLNHVENKKKADFERNKKEIELQFIKDSTMIEDILFLSR